MLTVGCCSNPKCKRPYKLAGYKEFLVKLNDGDIRVESVCNDCFKKLNKDMAETVFQEDKEYMLNEAKNNILLTSMHKEIRFKKWQDKKIIAYGKTMDDL